MWVPDQWRRRSVSGDGEEILLTVRGRKSPLPSALSLVSFFENSCRKTSIQEIPPDEKPKEINHILSHDN